MTHRDDIGEATPPQPGDEGLAGLFESARVDGFNATQAAVLWGRVGVAVAAPPAASAPSGGGTAAGAGGTTLKAAATWVLGGALVMASAGLTTVGVAGRSLPNPDGSSPGGAVVVAPDMSGPARAEPSPVEDHPAVAPEPEPGSVAPRGARPPPVAAESPRARQETPARAPVAPAPPRAAAEVDVPPAHADVSPGRSASGAPRAESAGSRSAGVPAVTGEPQVASAPPSPTEPSVSEGALLLRARRVLASDPAEALDLTRQHARQFPTGALIPEREVLAIEALAGLGRKAEARAALASFRQQFPASPHLARLQALLASP